MQKVQPLVGATLLILAAQVPSAQSPVFGDVRVMVPTDADDSRAVVLGDLDADGDPDAVVANAGGQNRLFLNDGVGVFLDATELFPADADDTRDAAIGDVDGDGDFDVLFANAYQQNRLYLNDGTGAFTDASGQLPADTDATTALALGDVDGDGDLDLLLGNGGYSGQQTRLYLNDGLGSFSDATGQLPVNTGPTASVALADVDGDGELDALIGEGAFPGSIMVGEPNRLYVNGGSGVFTDGTGQLPVDADWTSSIAVGDVDGDGDLDLLLGSNDLFTGINLQNRLYLNGGGGFFTDATGQLPVDSDSTRAVELGDVDGDGDLDALIGNYQHNRLYLNDGSGVFADASGQLPSDFESTAALALGDVDGDTDLDAVLGNDYFRQNQLYLNDGAGAFTDVTGQLDPAPPDYTPAVAVGDVDGDGDADVLIADYADQNKLLLNDGTGVLTDATGQLPPDSDSTHAVALGDVDGDGSLDAILPSYASFDPTLLYLNTGAGVFIDATVLLPPNADQSRDAAMGDVDGDGDLDVLIGNYGGNRLYLNNGLGAFTDVSSQLPPHADFTEAVVLGDVDGAGA